MKLNRHHFRSTNDWIRRITQFSSLFGLVWLISLTNLMTVPVLAYDPHFRLPWAPGVAYKISGSQYGEGLHTGSDYYATDFGVPFNDEVRAAQGGYATTATAGGSPSYGNYVIVDHGNGFITLHAHLNSFAVANGVNVVQGQLIGRAGDTGSPSQFHLHFAGRFNGTAYMAEPMSGYTGFGNALNFNSTLYTNNPLLSNVMSNGSFETYPVFTEDGGQWRRTSGTNWARLSGGAHDGTYYLEMNTGSVGGGAAVWQQFALNDGDWSNYSTSHTFISTPDTWTVRGWMRTSNCVGASGTLAIWAIYGPAQENGSTATGLTGSWKLFSATVHFSNDGHNRLQVQFYMDTVGCNYDFDGFTFVRNYANNTSFEDGFAYWNTYHGQSGSCTVNYAVYSGSPPDDGKYLETNRGTCTSGTVSVYQDVAAYTSVNDIYTVGVWIRSAGGSAISGTIALWGNGGMQENGSLGWSIGSGDFTWHEYVLTKTMSQSGHTSMRIELYLDANGPNYDFDGVQLSGGAGS